MLGTRIKRSRVLFASGFGIVSITRLNFLCACSLLDPSNMLPLYSNRCAFCSALRFWQCMPLEVCVALDFFLPIDYFPCPRYRFQLRRLLLFIIDTLKLPSLRLRPCDVFLCTPTCETWPLTFAAILETPLLIIFISNSMLKCFVKLECDCLEQIQLQTINYLKQHTNLLESKPKEPWCTTDTRMALQNIPALINWCKQNKFLPHEISFIVSHDSSSGLCVHTDQGPLVAKVNIPILNTQGNITRWWNNDVVIAETPMNVPVIFNSSIPHSVDIHSDTLPRVVMAVMMRNENVLLESLGGE